MVKRRVKKTGNQPGISHDAVTGTDGKQTQPEKNGGSSADQELERQIAAVKAISDIQVEHLLTGLRLLRSNFTEEQLRIPVLQFFKDNLPNVAVVRNADQHFELRWKDENGHLSMYTAAKRDIHASLLHRMSMAFPSCSTARESFGGYQFSADTIKTGFVGGDDLHMGNYMSQESLNNLILGLPEGLQTPGVNSQRLSMGTTPKTLRLPKPGEMLLSVHGSPLGVYKEDNMEAIHEAEEG